MAKKGLIGTAGTSGAGAFLPRPLSAMNRRNEACELIDADATLRDISGVA
jgi:hypothetical protein